MIEQQRNIKKKDYRSLVLYLSTLNIQWAIGCTLLTILTLLKMDRVFSCLIMVFECLVCDMILKAYYFQLYRKSSKESSPGLLKERKRMWMEGISFIKDFLCLVPVVLRIHQAILIFSKASASLLEMCHLLGSMVLLVYFVVATYFMISQAFCYHYAVDSGDQYTSATHLLLFFQVFTLKTDDARIWYFAASIGLFTSLTGVVIASAVYASNDCAAPVYRTHRSSLRWLLVSADVWSCVYETPQSLLGLTGGRRPR